MKRAVDIAIFGSHRAGATIANLARFEGLSCSIYHPTYDPEYCSPNEIIYGYPHDVSRTSDNNRFEITHWSDYQIAKTIVLAPKDEYYKPTWMFDHPGIFYQFNSEIIPHVKDKTIVISTIDGDGYDSRQNRADEAVKIALFYQSLGAQVHLFYAFNSLNPIFYHLNGIETFCVYDNDEFDVFESNGKINFVIDHDDKKEVLADYLFILGSEQPSQHINIPGLYLDPEGEPHFPNVFSIKRTDSDIRDPDFDKYLGFKIMKSINKHLEMD